MARPATPSARDEELSGKTTLSCDPMTVGHFYDLQSSGGEMATIARSCSRTLVRRRPVASATTSQLRSPGAPATTATATH